MITIKALGGSGEDSRNCFLICFDTGSILLDCGVKREIAQTDKVYPLLTKEIVDKLDGVFLSHCHEDHSAALPYLYHLGYKGSVYASKETIDLTPSFLNKWQKYVLDNNGQLPFDKQDTNKIIYKEVDNNTPYLIKYGRSGHVLGGLWYLFEIEGKRILYTGDITFESYLLETDKLPEADYLIIDSAYASRILKQKKQYQSILESINTTLKTNNTVLLPVPSNGRAIDIYHYLNQHNIPTILEETILKASDTLFSHKEWIKDVKINKDINNTTIANDKNREDINLEGKVILSPDGMMTNEKAIYYFNKIKNNSNNKVIITGHSAIGTLARNIQDKDYCLKNDIKLNVENITIKVHLDKEDVLSVVKKVNPEKVILFHSKQKDCEELKNSIEDMNIKTVSSINEELS